MEEEKTETKPIQENPYISRFQLFFETQYKKSIEKLIEHYPENKSLEVDFKQLEHFDVELADDLLLKPDYLIEAAKLAIQEIDLPNLSNDKFLPYIRIYNLPEGTDTQPQLMDIGAVHLEKLLTIEGVVAQITEVLPKLKAASWECRRCGNTYRVIQSGNHQQQPVICECHHKDFSLKAEDSEFEDYQKIRIQEPIEFIKGNNQPTNIDIYVSNNLVNRVTPGDRTKFTGILRLMPPKEKKIVYGRFLEAIHIEDTQQEFTEVKISKEEEKEIKILAKDPNVYDKLIKSIAPNIYGHESIKEAIVLQLFGGVKKVFPGQNKARGNIHIILIGEPGMAKCVDGNTKLMLSDGATRKISELVEESLNYEKITLNDGYYSSTLKRLPVLNEDCNFVNANAIRAYKRKPERMFFVKTATGKELKVTHTHPLFVSCKGKVKAIKTMNLKQGDFIAIPRKLSVKGKEQNLITDILKGKTSAKRIKLPQKLDEETARFVGYVLAEGYVHKNKSSVSVRFTNSDKEVIQDFVRLSKKIFNLKIGKRFRNNAFEIILSSVELYNFVKKNFPELLELSKNKQISDLIMRSPDNVVKSMLKVFIETEGHIRKDGRIIEVTSASRELIENLVVLLARFEITGTLKKIRNAATNSKLKTKRDYFRLRIMGKFSQKYVKEIGFISARKVIKSKKYISNSKIFNTNIDIVPEISQELLFIRKKLGLTQYEMGVNRGGYQHYERGDRNPSREQLFLIVNQLVENYLSNDIFDKKTEEKILNLFKLSKTDIFWDKIKEIREIKPSQWVYDLEVEGTHNFISNMVFSHNSQLLQAVDKIAPKSIYTAGKTTSAAGLSATAVKDEFGEGGWTIKAGALVLASGGIALIDELDKMDATDRSAIHEAAEQQSISVSKAGIVTRFKAETSILSAANPKYSRFDPYTNFLEQVNLPASLMSRFDLFFLIRDVLDKKKDAEIADHILKTHRAGEMLLQKTVSPEIKKEMEELQKIVTPAIEQDLFKKYISYARQNIFPVLTKESIKDISDFYINLREQGRKEGAYAATHRQLEGLVRLSEASAKVRLSETVEKMDTDKAIRIFKKSLEELVVDQETGRIDIDIITTGRTATELNNLKKVLSIVREKGADVDMVPVQDIIEEAKTQGINDEKTREIMTKLEKSGDIYRPRHGFVKPTQQK